MMTLSEPVAEAIANPPRVHHGWRWWLLTAVATVAIVGSAVALMVAFSVQSARNAEVACQAQINDDFQNKIAARNDPNVKDRAAQDAYNQADAEFTAVVSTSLSGIFTSPAQSVAAIRSAADKKQQAYAALQAARADDDAARAALPLTPAAPGACR